MTAPMDLSEYERALLDENNADSDAHFFAQKLSDARAALRPLEGLLQHAVIEHPTPWHIVRDWTVEVIDSEGSCVAKFQAPTDAHALVDAAAAIEAARPSTEQVEAFINGDDRAMDNPALTAVPLCAHCGQSQRNHIDGIGAARDCVFDLDEPGVMGAGVGHRAAPDPAQAAEFEGSVTHADLLAVRERYGALYAAVFPIMPTLLCMFIERSSSPSDRKSAREAFTQLEACK